MIGTYNQPDSMTTTVSPSDVGLWYERYGSSLRWAAARVTGDPDDADDALQDAFLAAWRSRSRFDGARDPLPWLLTIAKRKAVTIVAHRKRPAPAAHAPAVQPSAEDEVVRRESDRLVQELTRDEPALALYALAGLPARVVGERLGVPMRTAASRIARGRRRIEAALPATSPCPARSNLS